MYRVFVCADEPSPSQLLLSMYDGEVTQSSAAEVNERARHSPTEDGSFTSRPVQDVPATASRMHKVNSKQNMGTEQIHLRSRQNLTTVLIYVYE